MADYDVVSHWHQYLVGLTLAPSQFYEELEALLENEKIPNAKRERVNCYEGSLGSARREYLRVSRFDHRYDIGGFPFGNGFVVSWWLSEKSGAGCLGGCLSIVPGLSLFVALASRGKDYFRVDSAIAFQAVVHQAVLSLVDRYTSAQGIAALAPEARQPTIREQLLR